MPILPTLEITDEAAAVSLAGASTLPIAFCAVPSYNGCEWPAAALLPTYETAGETTAASLAGGSTTTIASIGAASHYESPVTVLIQ